MNLLTDCEYACLTMRILSIVSQKGGAGKTTLATHLAVAAHLAGLKAGVLDLDPQSSASKWGDIREEDPLVTDAKAERLPKFVEAARGLGMEFLILDTPPSASNEAHHAIAASDLIIVPCRPGFYDLAAIKNSILASRNQGKPAFVVFNAAAPRTDLQVKEVQQSLVRDGIGVVDGIIHQRAVFNTSAGYGRTAQEVEPDGKAAEEIRQLYGWVANQVGLPTGKQTNKRRKAGAR